jgi:DNA-binding transcriptional LysR family regulator
MPLSLDTFCGGRHDGRILRAKERKMIKEIEGELLQWLRGFYAVAEQGSVTQATDLMGREHVSLGLGVAVLSGYVITKQDKEMLDIYDLDEYFPKRKVAVLIRKRKYLSPAASAFLRIIKPGIRFTK